MGTYATTTSLQTIMIGTTFDSKTSSLCDKMITHAENEINKYLSKRYDLSDFSTSTSVPPLVTSLCETLTEGYMYHRNSRGTEKWSKHGAELIKQATENLKLIAEYKLDLVGADGLPISDMSNTAYQVRCNTTEYAPTFDEDNETSWRVDQDKLDDIESERD